MRFARIVLRASRESIPAVHAFYREVLGLAVDGTATVLVGETTLVFEPCDGEPFYHFAFLVPGDRFAAACDWVSARVELLPGDDPDDVVRRFDAWDALACYFLDPAGNIVELIAHLPLEVSGASGPFVPRELIGVSEIGLVGDPGEMAAALGDVGLRVWDGVVADDRIAFVGERARTLILSPPGRAWLSSKRPAVPWPVDVVISGGPSNPGPRSGPASPASQASPASPASPASQASPASPVLVGAHRVLCVPGG